MRGCNALAQTGSYTLIVQVYLLENGRYENIGVYTQRDIVRVNVLKSCFVELSRVFTE